MDKDIFNLFIKNITSLTPEQRTRAINALESIKEKSYPKKTISKVDEIIKWLESEQDEEGNSLIIYTPQKDKKYTAKTSGKKIALKILEKYKSDLPTKTTLVNVYIKIDFSKLKQQTFIDYFYQNKNL